MIIATSSAVAAQQTGGVDVEYEASALLTTGEGDFAPYYLSANRHGILTQPANALLDARVEKHIDLSKRFSWSAGLELVGGAFKSTAYLHVRNGEWVSHECRPSRVMLQQAYATVKWRGVFLTAGMREHESALLNFRLSSGDLVESGNACPLPEGRIGFIDFQDVPFTNGWLQIQGECSYGKFMDNHWLDEHFNGYNYHIVHGSWLNYKRWYFRTKPSQPFSATFGAQSSNTFGGTAYYYRDGHHIKTSHYGAGLKDFLEAFLPINSREDFRLGNSLGSWDFKGRYRLRNGAELSAYFQWPWEDGSSLGRRNGWDGLWGLEYKAAHRCALDGVVVEYLDFTNQSGPLHWAPDDRPGTTITSPATGADDYYNNAYYNSYANYGLSIGTPFMKAPLYNLDGYLGFLATRLRGFHIAAEGHPTESLSWRAACSYRKAWGNGKVPLLYPEHDFSAMLECGYNPRSIPGLEALLTVAVDRGNLLGNNWGVQLAVSYTGLFTIK